MEFGSVILWLLWRFFPVLWLDRMVARLIAWAVELIENEDKFAWLCERPANAQWFGGWLRIAEARLDELIALRALQLLGRRLLATDVPAHYPTPAIRTPAEALARLHRLCGRYLEDERLARLRAFKLRRLYAAVDPLGRIEHRPTTTAVVASLAAPLAAPFPPSAAGWGRWIDTQRRSGGGIRAPPVPGISLEVIGRGGHSLRNFQQISGIAHRHWKRFQPASNASLSLPIAVGGSAGARACVVNDKARFLNQVSVAVEQKGNIKKNKNGA